MKFKRNASARKEEGRNPGSDTCDEGTDCALAEREHREVAKTMIFPDAESMLLIVAEFSLFTYNFRPDSLYLPLYCYFLSDGNCNKEAYTYFCRNLFRIIFLRGLICSREKQGISRQCVIFQYGAPVEWY